MYTSIYDLDQRTVGPIGIGIARYVRPTEIFISNLCLAETLQGLSKNFLDMLKSLLESFKDLPLFG